MLKNNFNDIIIASVIGVFLIAHNFVALLGVPAFKIVIHLSLLIIIASGFIWHISKIASLTQIVFDSKVVVLIDWLFVILFLHAIAGILINANFSDGFHLLNFLLIYFSFRYCTLLSREAIKLSLWVMFVVGLIYSVVSLFNRDLVYQYAGNYLTITLMIGACYIYGFYNAINNEHTLMKIIFLVSSFVLLFSLTQYLSRATLILCVFFSIVIVLTSKYKIRSILLLTVSIYISFVIFSSNYNEFLLSGLYKRLALFQEDGLGPRAYVYSEAFRYISEHWLEGSGVGLSGINIYNDKKLYPHNLLLHGWVEFGALGAIFVGVFIIYSITLSIRSIVRSTTHLQAVCSFIFIYLLFSFFKSFSIYDSWVLFMFSGFLVSLERQIERPSSILYAQTNSS